MADTRTTTPYNELAEMVAGLDMIDHTWSVAEVLAGELPDDDEDRENVRTYVHNAQAFLARVEQALSHQRS